MAAFGLLLMAALAVAGTPEMMAQAPPPTGAEDPLTFEFQLRPLREAALGMTVAASLATALAFRPRRRGTPERSAAVAQTQIILACVGAVVMIVVGASLARAFGIVGAASLVRYRAKVSDPKDAGVMLSTLTIGLASGVGLYFFAIFATAFIGIVLWALESGEPEDSKRFELKLTFKDIDGATLRPRVEELLRHNRIAFELRTTTAAELCYDVVVPVRKTTARLSNLILALEKEGKVAVEWDQKKDKK